MCYWNIFWYHENYAYEKEFKTLEDLEKAMHKYINYYKIKRTNTFRI
ncbi:IS3 family transposase [Mycoplasmopsis bovirhinis]